MIWICAGVGNETNGPVRCGARGYLRLAWVKVSIVLGKDAPPTIFHNQAAEVLCSKCDKVEWQCHCGDSLRLEGRK